MKVVINAETGGVNRVPLSENDLAQIKELKIIRAIKIAQKIIDNAEKAQFKTEIALKLKITEEELSRLKDIL